MKLEAIDIKNTNNLCPATIEDVLDNRILIHIDGTDETYNYWTEITSPNIHPINWHKENNITVLDPTGK